MVQTEQQYICIHQCIVCILQQNNGNSDQQELLDQEQQDLELTGASTMLAHHNRAFEGTSLMLNSKTTAFIVRCGILWLNAAVTSGIPTVVGGFWSRIDGDGNITTKVPSNNAAHNNVPTINTIITTNAYNKSWWSSWWKRKSSSNNVDDIYCL